MRISLLRLNDGISIGTLRRFADELNEKFLAGSPMPLTFLGGETGYVLSAQVRRGVLEVLASAPDDLVADTPEVR